MENMAIHSDVIEDLLDYYEKREGKPQKKVKL
jgi:hypothetical protein